MRDFDVAGGETVVLVLSTFSDNAAIGAWTLNVFTQLPPGEPNDVFEDAESIESGQPLERALNLQDDVDWYTFTIAFDAIATMETSSLENGNNADTQMWLCDETDPANCTYDDGHIVRNDDIGGGNLFSRLLDISLAPGTYYIGVQGFRGGTGEYAISLDVIHEGPGEPNGDFSMAAPLGVGEEITAAMEVDGDEDWYTFTLDAADTLTISTSDPGLVENVDTVLFVCDTVDPANCTRFNNLASNDDSNGSVYSTITGLALDAGTYYVVVIAPFSNNTGDYTLSIMSTP